jgi:hypothetical protein
MATEPVTVTDSDVQSLEKKLLEFAETLPQAEQMYLAGMLAKVFADEVEGYADPRNYHSAPSMFGGGTILVPGPEPPPPPRTPAQKLKDWARDMGVKV